MGSEVQTYSWKISKEVLARVSFWGLGLLIFFNINAILLNYTGTSAVASPLILLFSVVLWFLTPPPYIGWKHSYFWFVVFVVFFLVMGMVSALWQYDRGIWTAESMMLGVRQVGTAVIVFTAVYGYVYRSFQLGRSDEIWRAFTVLFVVTLLAGVMEDYLGLRQLLKFAYQKSRTLGFFGNPNETGMQANLTWILAMYWFLRTRRWQVAALVLVLLSTYGAVISFSRTAIAVNAGLWVVTAVYFLMRGVRRYGLLVQPREYAWMAFFVVFALGIVPYVVMKVYDRLDSVQKRRVDTMRVLVEKGQFDNQTTAMRAGIFKEALRYIAERPLLGHGLQALSKGGVFRTSPDHGVHNMYLKVAGEAGVGVMLLYLWLILWPLWKARHLAYPESLLVVWFVFVVGVHSLSTHSLLAHKFVVGFWALIYALVDQVES